MTTQEITEKVLEAYNLGLNYVDAEYNEMPVKFRINKDHARNGFRNDNNECHNLSLINVYGNGASEVDCFFLNEDEDEEIAYIQKQVWGVMDIKDVEREIEDFLSDIDYEN